MDRRMMAAALTLLAALLVLTAGGAAARLYGASGVLITIDEYGVAHVVLNVSVSSGLGSVVLPAKPVVASLIVSEDGRLLTPIYIPENNTLFFVARAPGVVTVRYVANVTVEGGIVSFEVGNVTARLVLAPNVVLLDIPGRVLETGYDRGGRLYVVFQGPATVEYTVKTGGYTGVEGKPAETATVTRGTAAPGGGAGAGGGQGWLLYTALGVGVAIAALGVFLALRARKGRHSSPQDSRAHPSDSTSTQPPDPELSQVDVEILRALEARGGEALQSELQRTLGIPKSTLSRRLHRLQEKGYVEIERIGGVNRVRLRKKPW